MWHICSLIFRSKNLEPSMWNCEIVKLLKKNNHFCWFTLLSTYFLYCCSISLAFSFKYFEEKHLSCLLHCIFLPPKFITDVRVSCAWAENMNIWKSFSFKHIYNYLLFCVFIRLTEFFAIVFMSTIIM